MSNNTGIFYVKISKFWRILNGKTKSVERNSLILKQFSLLVYRLSSFFVYVELCYNEIYM